MRYRQYAAVVFLMGLGAMAAGQWPWASEWGPANSALAAAVAAMVGLTRGFPLKVSPQTTTSLGGAPLFLGVLLLGPFQIALAGVVGSLGADACLKRKPLVAAFNLGVTSVAASLAAATFLWVSPDEGTVLLLPSTLGAAMVAAAVVHASNLGLMVGMLCVRKGMSFWTTWRRTWVMDAVQEGGVLVLGFLAGSFTRKPGGPPYSSVCPSSLPTLPRAAV